MMFLKPDPRVNAIILACLTRAAAIHGIEVMGYVFMGNHFHLLVRAPKCNLSDFMKDFQQWLSVKIKHHHGLLEGIFSSRFDDVVLLDDAEVFEKLIYILANPVAAGLVDTLENYVGLSSLHGHLTDEPVVGRWVNQDKLRRLRARNPDADDETCVEYHELKLTPLPAMVAMAPDRRAKLIGDKLNGRCDKLRKDSEGAMHSPPYTKPSSPYDRPVAPKITPYSKPYRAHDPALCSEYSAFLEQTTQAYYQAKLKLYSAKGHKGAIAFPPGTTPPGKAKCIPFKNDELKQCRGRPTYRPHVDDPDADHTNEVAA